MWNFSTLRPGCPARGQVRHRKGRQGHPRRAASQSRRDGAPASPGSALDCSEAFARGSHRGSPPQGTRTPGAAHRSDPPHWKQSDAASARPSDWFGADGTGARTSAPPGRPATRWPPAPPPRTSVHRWRSSQAKRTGRATPQPRPGCPQRRELRERRILPRPQSEPPGTPPRATRRSAGGGWT